jgi:hypothetical protein
MTPGHSRVRQHRSAATRLLGYPALDGYDKRLGRSAAIRINQPRRPRRCSQARRCDGSRSPIPRCRPRSGNHLSTRSPRADSATSTAIRSSSRPRLPKNLCHRRDHERPAAAHRPNDSACKAIDITIIFEGLQASLTGDNSPDRHLQRRGVGHLRAGIGAPAPVNACTNWA